MTDNPRRLEAFSGCLGCEKRPVNIGAAVSRCPRLPPFEFLRTRRSSAFARTVSERATARPRRSAKRGGGQVRVLQGAPPTCLRFPSSQAVLHRARLPRRSSAGAKAGRARHPSLSCGFLRASSASYGWQAIPKRAEVPHCSRGTEAGASAAVQIEIHFLPAAYGAMARECMCLAAPKERRRAGRATQTLQDRTPFVGRGALPSAFDRRGPAFRRRRAAARSRLKISGHCSSSSKPIPPQEPVSGGWLGPAALDHREPRLVLSAGRKRCDVPLLCYISPRRTFA